MTDRQTNSGTHIKHTTLRKLHQNQSYDFILSCQNWFLQIDVEREIDYCNAFLIGKLDSCIVTSNFEHFEGI